jgi:putative serine protease PepD
VKRIIGALLGLMATLPVSGTASSGDVNALPSPEPFIAPLQMQPSDMAPYSADPNQVAIAMPRVTRQGEGGVQGEGGGQGEGGQQAEVAAPDARQIAMPVVVTPSHPQIDEQGNLIGKAGTGFFIADDGTLLTAAHVVTGCSRTQIISNYLPRTWASVVASDQTHDIAILKAMEMHPPAIVRVAAVPPVSDKLFVLGYPASAGLLIAAETWAVTQNQKFPADIGGLANPRELLWISAPEVTHGYSGGPIFDPKLGAVVGIVKGEVEGGYLRLVRDIPTTGIAIGPGIDQLAAVLRREAPYLAVNLVSSPVVTGEETMRRATVHVLCWH